jgi:hypothetical protein
MGITIVKNPGSGVPAENLQNSDSTQLEGGFGGI